NNQKKDNSTAEIISYFERQPEFFSFSPDSFFTVIGKEGTEISIMPECLVHQDGSLPTGEITLELKEHYNIYDVIFSNLSTQTKNSLLETSGMIYLQAKADGKVLKVKEGKNIEIKFPKKGKMKKGMRLFKGIRKNERVIWDENPISDTAKTMVPDSATFIYGEPNDPVSYELMLLDYYLFKTSKMGWLACAKLTPFSDITFSIKIDTLLIPNIKVISTNQHKNYGVCELSRDRDKLIFYGIPNDEEVMVFGFYKSEDKYYIYKKEITIKANIEETAVFREVSLEELKAEAEAVKQLNQW
ncbi:MAG: hypothetical protein KJZ55_09415, partial [Flavobacteriales bacterium]|nr:hypothetical protein [Flavobacteriales bacterium]